MTNATELKQAYSRTSDTDPLEMYGPLIGTRLSPGFHAVPYHTIEVVPVGTTIGAEVRGVHLGGGLSPQTRDELRQALLEWKVLFFRDQVLTRDDQRAFAALWGTIEEHPFFKYTQPGQTVADVVTLEKGLKSAGVENTWHNDNTWNARPSFGAVLRAVEIPAAGGDTLWADMAVAYDTLPEEIRIRIDGLWAEHDWIQAFGPGMPKALTGTLRKAFPPVRHPLVRVVPETGRRVLFASEVFTTRILDVDQRESDRLLSIIYRHVQRPEFQVRLRWRPNTVAMWDNRACQHYAASDYYPQRRVMERISIAGDVPRGVVA